MANKMKLQMSHQASARLIATLQEVFDTIIRL